MEENYDKWWRDAFCSHCDEESAKHPGWQVAWVTPAEAAKLRRKMSEVRRAEAVGSFAPCEVCTAKEQSWTLERMFVRDDEAEKIQWDRLSAGGPGAWLNAMKQGLLAPRG